MTTLYIILGLLLWFLGALITTAVLSYVQPLFQLELAFDTAECIGIFFLWPIFIIAALMYLPLYLPIKCLKEVSYFVDQERRKRRKL